MSMVRARTREAAKSQNEAAQNRSRGHHAITPGKVAFRGREQTVGTQMMGCTSVLSTCKSLKHAHFIRVSLASSLYNKTHN